MLMRIRWPELLVEHQTTPYRVAMRSDGRIKLSTAYRLSKVGGAVRYIDSKLLDALCDVLEIGPDELLTADPAPDGAEPTPPAKPAKKAKPARKRAKG